jgi:ribosomal protein S18 acetylase RimI-like enzyme
MTSPLDEVEVPERPGIPGLRFRHLRQPDDFPGMAAANQRTRDVAGIEEVVDPEAMARDYAHFVNWDPHDDTVIAERDGAIVGYVRVDWRDLTDGTRGFQIIVVVDPAVAGVGIESAFLAWAEARQAAKARAIPVVDRRPSLLRTFSFGAEAALSEALTDRGWTRTGHGHEMVRATLDDIPDLPLPDGLVIGAVGDLAEQRRVWDAASEAFRDERGEAEPTEEDWQNELADPLEDPSLWVIAHDGSEVAGGVQGRIDPVENAYHGRERGYLEGVWVRRPWRRRGLARALIARTFQVLRDRGMTSAYLSVDGLNPNQAMDLYEGLGFTSVSTTYDWQMPLPPDVAPAAPIG